MEELRGIMADRFVLTLINGRTVSPEGFTVRENGGIVMSDECRKSVLTAWQAKKKEQITHPYLGEKMPWGLVPHVQALLLSRFLRRDLDGYPPFLWK
jgi:CRISPR-associated protein Cas1